METTPASNRMIGWWMMAVLAIGAWSCEGTVTPDTTEPSDTAGDIDRKDAGTDTGGTTDTGGMEADTGVRDAADTGDCPDGGPPSLPMTSPGHLVATPVEESEVAIDGLLREGSQSGLEFGDADGPSDNRATVHARWNDAFLYLGAEVADDQIEADSPTGPWRNDSVEIGIDPQSDGGFRLASDDRKWLADVDGTTSTSRGESGNWVDTSTDEATRAVERDDDGFVAEFQIPWSAIGGFDGVRNQQGPGFTIVVNDRDDGEVRRFSWMGPNELDTPAEWGALQVAEPSCGSDASDAGDAGSDPGDAIDTGEDSDVETGGGSEPRLGPPRHVQESDFNFQTTLDAVDDLGMDPTGQEPIDDKLDSARASNTLIEFPPGKYKIKAGPDRNATHDWGADAEHFGLKGLGDKPKDVQFVLEKQPANYGGRWIRDHGGEGLMLKNFAIQMHRDRYTSTDMFLRKEDLLLLEKIEYAGLIPNDKHGTNALLSAEITDRSGVGEINRLYMREGSYMPDYPNGTAGLRLSLGHKGTLYMTDLWLEQVSSSAIRFTKVPGRVGVEGGFYKNNANTNLRGSAGSHPDGPSYMRGATVVIDTTDFNDYQPSGEPLTPTQAIRVDSSGQGYSGMLIEDIDIHFLNVPSGSEVITRPGFGDHGAFTVRDLRIRNETGRPTALISNVSKPSNETARFENVHVTGSGSGTLRADGGTSAEIVDSCVESGFSIQNFDVVDNVSRSNCDPPTSPTAPPHDH